MLLNCVLSGHMTLGSMRGGHLNMNKKSTFGEMSNKVNIFNFI